MENCVKTHELILSHFEKYPKLRIEDLYKFLYQGVFGPGHMIPSRAAATEYITSEIESCPLKGATVIEELDGDFCRVSLSCLTDGLSADTLGGLFYLSAKGVKEDRAAFIERLGVLEGLILSGALPYSIEDYRKTVGALKDAGYPAVHHSDAFRENYHPAYRVIRKEFVPFLPLFARIDSLLAKKDTLTVAIDGGCAGGKSTLAGIIEELYGATVFHMDDFFLRPEQRTKERYLEVGGNVDRERFLDEVLIPLKRGATFSYRKFDCSTFTLGEKTEVTPRKLRVIEGTYSHHPTLTPYYDLSVFLDVPLKVREGRIKVRNSPKMAERFFNEWIPLEEKYFSEMQVKERADMHVDF